MSKNFFTLTGGLSAALEPGALVADFVSGGDTLCARPEALVAVITA